MARFLIPLCGLAAVCSSTARAQTVLVEEFPSPLSSWMQGWLWEHSNLDSFYVAAGNCDPNFRGNNPCGLWLVDTRGCNSIAAAPTINWVFSSPFAESIGVLEFDVRAFSTLDISIFDTNGLRIGFVERLQNQAVPPCGGLTVRVESSAGVQLVRFDATNYGMPPIQGETSIDNVKVTIVEPCYADCDTSTGSRVLDIFDFLCFQNRFGRGSAYACDCDTTTGASVCDIFDFLCFSNHFANGCR